MRHIAAVSNQIQNKNKTEKDDVQTSLRFKEDGTVEVHRWIAEVPYDAFGGLAKACKEGRLEEDLPTWTNNRNRTVWETTERVMS